MKSNKNKKILVTGSQGYVGTELLLHLNDYGYKLTCLDAGFFKESWVSPLPTDSTLLVDIRNLESEMLVGIDTVIHLASLSNDPLGDFNLNLTYEINEHSAVKLAQMSKDMGVERFIFISTQSVYGFADNNLVLDENGTISPITAYAKSKWEAEKRIRVLKSKNFHPTIIRPATVFGWGSRMRTDIIFNNLISSGLRQNRIRVNTDGTPFRPVLHVRDLIDFITLLIELPCEITSGQTYNMGLFEKNYTVIEIAEIASECLGGIPIDIKCEDITDSRSYRVSFQKAYDQLGFKAVRDLKQAGIEIVQKFKALTSKEQDKFFNDTNRLKTLDRMVKDGTLSEDLKWL
jgi:nucleoside-diphosphate-sugar epimerase